MSSSSIHPDKNLINTVKDLEATPVTSQQAQQFQQQKNDRRKEALKTDNEKFQKTEQNTYK
ncbi:hypothetical protein [Paenibacillus sp. SN-8-1]|uniref:hypothetical protein n=1 Tax=Paenibacillus sp. SN-8-1 TaxID=3435409 RepID=UPI003D9A8377